MLIQYDLVIFVADEGWGEKKSLDLDSGLTAVWLTST